MNQLKRAFIGLLSRIVRRQPNDLLAEHPFGNCPVCGRQGVYGHVFKNEFMLCEIDRIYWSFGYNLLSSWESETRQDWQRLVERLGAFTPASPTDFFALQLAQEHLDTLGAAWDEPLTAQR